MGSPEWGGSLLSVCQLLSCSSKQLYPNSFGYTNPHRKGQLQNALSSGRRKGSPRHATLPSAVHRNIHRKASFRADRGPQIRENWKTVLRVLWGQRSQKGSSERNSMVVRRMWGVLLSGVGGGHSRGSGEAVGAPRVSGGPQSSPTLGVCGAGTCGRRSGSTFCTGTS